MRPSRCGKDRSFRFFAHVKRSCRRWDLLRTHVLMVRLRKLSISAARGTVRLVGIVMLLVRALAIVRLGRCVTSHRLHCCKDLVNKNGHGRSQLTVHRLVLSVYRLSILIWSCIHWGMLAVVRSLVHHHRSSLSRTGVTTCR